VTIHVVKRLFGFGTAGRPPRWRRRKGSHPRGGEEQHRSPRGRRRNRRGGEGRARSVFHRCLVPAAQEFGLTSCTHQFGFSYSVISPEKLASSSAIVELTVWVVAFVPFIRRVDCSQPPGGWWGEYIRDSLILFERRHTTNTRLLFT